MLVITDEIGAAINTDGTTTYAWTNDNPLIDLRVTLVRGCRSKQDSIVVVQMIDQCFGSNDDFNIENNGFTCVGDPETFTITVNPGAQVDPVVSQVLCVGNSTDEIVFTTTNTDGTTTYT